MSLLATACFLFAIAPSRPIAVISPVFTSEEFGAKLEKIPDPSDPTKTITVRVSYVMQAQHVSADPMPGPLVAVTARTRPSAPHPPFELHTTYQSEADSNREAVATEMYLAATELGAAYTIGSVIQQALEDASQRINSENSTVKIDPNIGIAEGGWTTRGYGHEAIPELVSVQIYKTLELPTGTSRVRVKDGTIRLGERYRPIQDLISQSFQPDPKLSDPVQDYIEDTGGVRFMGMNHPNITKHFLSLSLPTYKGSLSDLTAGLRYEVNPARVQLDLASSFSGKDTLNTRITESGLAVSTINNFIDRLGIEAEGMNQFSVPGFPQVLENPCSGELYYPPGTLWLPSRPGYQVMASQSIIRTTFAFEASIEIDAAIQEQRQGRWHCLNMELKEPEKGVKYFPYRPADSTISRLSRLTEKSPFKGPWDQARTWIYTDRAPLAEINKRMIPGISGGQYINGLADVAQVAGLKQADFANGKLFDPNLLGNGYARDKALDWFLGQLKKHARKQFESWAKTNLKNLLQRLRDPDKDIAGQQARILHTVCEDEDPAVRKAAMDFIGTLQPSDAAALDEKRGWFRTSLYRGSASEVKAALDHAKRLGIKPPKDALGYVIDKGADEVVKAAAKALFGG